MLRDIWLHCETRDCANTVKPETVLINSVLDQGVEPASSRQELARKSTEKLEGHLERLPLLDSGKKKKKSRSAGCSSFSLS